VVALNTAHGASCLEKRDGWRLALVRKGGPRLWGGGGVAGLLRVAAREVGGDAKELASYFASPRAKMDAT
jgi:hypothetical protein